MSSRLKLVVGFLPALVVYALYAHARFGTWYDPSFYMFFTHDINGHFRYPNLGPFSLHYFSMNFWTVMFAPPQWIPTFPFYKPHLYGQALWTISPAFVITIAASWLDSETLWLWIATALIMIPSMFVFTNGQE